jgi:glycosyltransferase involved in cell wall biosynthesis
VRWIRFDQAQRTPLERYIPPAQDAQLPAGRREPASLSRPHSDHTTAVAEAFLSVVIPARNEAVSLPRLMEETVGALRAMCGAHGIASGRILHGFEVIVVDDGSEDGTPAVLRDLSGRYPELHPVRLASSAGQSAAIIAGIRGAQGNWIATLDADLQNDPADLVTLWTALGANDVALGWRARRADSWSRRVISQLANRCRNFLLCQNIRDTGCSVRLFPRALALQLPPFQGIHRFFGSLFLREGCRIIQVPVHHRPRVYGRSHYGLRNRSWRVVVDLLGIAWLMRRPISYHVIERTRPTSRSSLEVQSAYGAPHDWRQASGANYPGVREEAIW